MAFGKRSVTARAATRSAAPQGRDRVIPAEVWGDDKLGQMLRTLGLTPDDERNLIPNSQSVQARLDHGRALLDARLDKANAALRAKGGGALRPFYLIPDPCWNGEMGHLLMLRLDLFPHENWNVALLPTDERTALMLDMPLHPNGNVPALIDAAEKFMSEADHHLRVAHAEATETQDFARFGDTREDIRERVRGLAHFFLGRLDAAWKNKRPGRA